MPGLMFCEPHLNVLRMDRELSKCQYFCIFHSIKREHFSQLLARVFVFITTVFCSSSSRCHCCFCNCCFISLTVEYSSTHVVARMWLSGNGNLTLALRALVWLLLIGKCNDLTFKLGPLICQTCLLVPTSLSKFKFLNKKKYYTFRKCSGVKVKVDKKISQIK